MQKTLAPDKHEINKIQRAFSSVYKIQGRGAVVGEITGIGLPLRAWPNWHNCKNGMVRLEGQRSIAIAAYTEGQGIVAVKGKILVADNCSIRYAGDEAFAVLMRDIRALCLGNAVHNMAHIAAVQIAGNGGRVGASAAREPLFRPQFVISTWGILPSGRSCIFSAQACRQQLRLCVWRW